MKIQKYLAQNSNYSRRKIEDMIRLGEVYVNQKRISIGHQVNIGDEIVIDSKLWQVKKKESQQTIIIYNKPLGEIVTQNDEQGRRTVFSSLPACQKGRWIAVGRLDINTQGLMIFCSDGDVAHCLMHPSSGLLRQYKVRVFGEVDTQGLRDLQKGVLLDGQICRFNSITPLGEAQGKNQWFHVSVYTGKYRMVRRLWEKIGCKVNRLVRIAFGPIKLPADLPLGKYQLLAQADYLALKQTLGIK
ncbi:MAG: pseudouridine synthase [Pseudomonadota bacterium]|nr:pseudouridine synthase [Pseudomonadota bacterium]